MLAAASMRLGAQTSYLLNSPGAGSIYLDHGNTTSVDTIYPISYYNLGYEFTTGASPLSVTALGIYDTTTDGFSGFNGAHGVGLWNTSGTLLATVTVAAGIQALTNGFAFVSLGAPVTLLAGTNYILSAVWNAPAGKPQDGLRFNPNGSGPTLTGATLVGDRYGAFGTGSSSPLLFPSGTNWSNGNTFAGSPLYMTTPLAGGLGASYVGANMAFSAIPEPSTYAAIAGAAMLGLAVWRRRRRTAPTVTSSVNAVA